MPSLYVIIILSAIFTMNFWLLTCSSPSSPGRASSAWFAPSSCAPATSNMSAPPARSALEHTIMFRHMLPNAMVATLTLLPFIITGAIGGLAALDFLGLGLPPRSPSLGELALQGKNRLQRPLARVHGLLHLRHHALACSLHLRGVRDAFDPRKTFR